MYGLWKIAGVLAAIGLVAIVGWHYATSWHPAVKDYPLQPECNKNVLRPLHLAACDAAVALRLA